MANQQESVWDYPRPPKLEKSARRVRVRFAGHWIADSVQAFRVLETSHPPVYYIPRSDVRTEFLTREQKSSFCEFKGTAVYWSLEVNGQRVSHAAWSYPAPAAGFEPMEGCFAFYAGRVEACFVDDELVTPQPGDFYGGWITSDIVGPFKGAQGTAAW
jgi:uncharacterized protein (DUF427 family)